MQRRTLHASYQTPLAPSLSLSSPLSLFLIYTFYCFSGHSFSPCRIECARSPLVAIIHKVMNMASLIGTWRKKGEGQVEREGEK